MVMVDKAGCAKPAGPTTRRQWTNESPEFWQLFPPQLYQPGHLRPAVGPHNLQQGQEREGLGGRFLTEAEY